MHHRAKFAIGLAGWMLLGVGAACSRTGLLEDPYESSDWPASCSRKALRLRVVEEPPNLYFVLDRSGSMAESMPGVQSNKYAAVRQAVVALVKKLGSHVNVGAAVFPAAGRLCQPGEEVFATTRGDDLAGSDVDGPVTTAFAEAINVVTLGYTPTASTLQNLLPTLSKLSGKKAVVLATDGGPNCNADARCDASECISNIQQVSGCSSSANCCSPSAGPDAPRMCLDREPTLEAVRALKEADISTYVIGIPGSQAFTELLSDLAEAGGTARKNEPRYYAVGDVDALVAALEQIGGELVTCDMSLDELPLEPGDVKVFLDGEEIGRDHSDGFTWTGSRSFRLLGPSCTAFREGRIKRIDAFAHCDDGQPPKP